MSSKSEEWKDITGYEGLYQVSTLGNVRSYDKIVGCRGGKTRLVKGKILAPARSGNGYVKVMLTKNKTRRNRNVHRLVAEAFIPNLDGFTDINHINEIKTDNRVSNLEWCSRCYNNHYSRIPEKMNEAKKIRVKQVSLDGEIINVWNGIREAARALGIKSHRHISDCCKGKAKTCYGFKWEYC